MRGERERERELQMRLISVVWQPLRDPTYDEN